MNFSPSKLELLSSVLPVGNLQWFLLIGSGVLAVSLLVLAMTKWGHSRPVWKCVILSFVAHILLLAYAWGTWLILEPPAVAEREVTPFRVNLTEEPAEAIDGSEIVKSSEPLSKSMKQFVVDQPLPTEDELSRPDFDTRDFSGGVLDRIPEKMKAKKTEISINSKERLSERTDFSETPEELAESSPSIKEQVEPKAIEFTRRGAENQDARSGLPFESDQSVERQSVESRIDSAAAIKKRIVADIDQSSVTPFVSDLVDSRSKFLSAPESVPKAPQVPSNPTQHLPVGFRQANNVVLKGAVRRLGDGLPLPAAFALRKSKNRSEIAKIRGGSVETEKAVELGLEWLADHQESDGSWSSQNSGGGREDRVLGEDRGGAGTNADNGITALATLAFLAGGDSHLEGRFQTEILGGLEFLVKQQKPNGDLSGDAKLFAKMYCHSMSLLALSEALAMTGDQRLAGAVRKGVSYSINAQNRLQGGWRYAPGDSGDMSQFGWQVLALHSARLGGILVPDNTFKLMKEFLDSCSSGQHRGLASYRPGQGASSPMTAEALLCRYILNKSVGPNSLEEAQRQINSDLPDEKQVNLYYWYYGTLAMYQAGGSGWERWNKALKRSLLALQNRDGEDAGSWPANGTWGGYGGRVYSTAIATLSLEVYYRYLPVYQQVAEQEIEPSKRR